jgi:hypothetical protein
MKIGLTVQYLAGESKKVNAQFADFIAFEREQNRSVVNFQTELKLTDLAWLAWHSEKRTKNTALDFDKWIETVDSVEVGGDGPIVPLESPQPTG